MLGDSLEGLTGSLPQRQYSHSYGLLQRNNTQQAGQGGKTHKVESGGIQTQASQVLLWGWNGESQKDSHTEHAPS